MKKIFSILFFLVIFFSLSVPILAQAETAEQLSKEETFEAKVEKILEEKWVKPMGATDTQLQQKLRLLITKGALKGEFVEIEIGNMSTVNQLKYEVGEKVMILKSQDFEGNDIYYISDFVRRDFLLWLLLIFVGVAVLVARGKGLMSLLGMAVSFLVIFFFILPNISKGLNPIIIVLLGSTLIIPATFFLSHGFNKKTIIAILGTFISLAITAGLSSLFINLTKLSGFASEEAGFLQFAKQGTVNIKGLLLAGIIIGVLGVLDDITISQSAIVFELKKANEKFKPAELYKRAMNVGRDHISSMVNTLILVYTGASLPLLLLFVDSPRPFSEVVNYEIVADEIVRTLVGSIGLVLAVPITTFIACFVVSKKN